MIQKLHPAFIFLQDETIHRGWSFIDSSVSFGEVVFNTGMTGYQEIMTDPSYAEQIIIFTYPEIGNTGINHEDSESNKIHIKGIVAKNFCLSPNSWKENISMINFISKNKIPNIFGIDTRALTKHIRNKGVMNGCICSNTSVDIEKIKNKLQNISAIENYDLAEEVTTKKIYHFSKSFTSNYLRLNYKTDSTYGHNLNIIVVDFGVKYSILSRLSSYGCSVRVMPAKSTYKEIVSHHPDGIILSNGPGDPSIARCAIKTIKRIIEFTNIPIFGICMGHQIISLALGCKTFKLRFGHRGINHPSGMSKRAEMTSQNHGFAVKTDSLPNEVIKITNLNLNDRTISTIIHTSKPVFSVQYHPESNPGPHDSDYLFKNFINLIKKVKEA
uniref:Carbamoyl phosphate synthase small chain n=1 Tax=Melanthalia intermedia TaxID=172989 RepID=A0A345UAH3_9FLOR|nr:carbamoyl phosphate synthase small subunit [Melanthalia intermedia]AXI97459.1 carbamoyl phosphate synthase small subunit [Melanthalia intermedia]